MHMLFMLKLTLVIFLNEAYAYAMQYTEITLLPAWNPSGATKVPLTLKVFGKLIQLNLRRNDKIVASEFEIWKHNTKGVTEKLSQLNTPDPCYYLHKDQISSAAINFCHKNGLEGLVILQNARLEIMPLQDNLASSLMGHPYVKKEANVSFGIPHVITRTLLKHPADSDFFCMSNLKRKRRHVENTEKNLTIELAVFVDKTARELLFPFLDKDDEKVRNLILAYINGIQAVFHHPSFGVPIDISLIYLEIMETQPSDLPNGGDAYMLLITFCKYMIIRNLSDDNPRHWDIGLYVTGIDLYRDVGDQRTYEFTGLAYRGGVCNNWSCAMVEFGVKSDHLLTTAGFHSIYAAAHEIGHVLGMRHDSDNNTCSHNKYIMAPTQGLREQTTWSECSREKAKKLWRTKPCLLNYSKSQNISTSALDHLRYHDLPGRAWTAKMQCELLLKDKEASVVTLHDVCESLQCDVPRSKEFFFAGPALDGTYCAPNKECRGGECVPVRELPVVSNFSLGRWTEWKEASCKSACLENSKGVIIRRRLCEKQNYSAADCEGPHYDVVLYASC
nr:PREDICTED: A disintegrin and metalloproteinase with thrombospondin motifs 19-like isoform X2 [Linepithema humile]